AGGGDHFFERVWRLGSQIPDTQPLVLAFGIAAIVLLVAGEKLLPARPVALFVVIASIVVLSVTPLAQMGFKTVGVLPAGLPDLALPSLRPRDADRVIALVFACCLLAAIQGGRAVTVRARSNRCGRE